MTKKAKPSEASSLKPLAWRDFFDLCKPRVVGLMMLTVVVGMYLAPGHVSFNLLFFSLLGIGLAASSAAAVNHIVDRQIDSLMARTQGRPLAQGRIQVVQAIVFALTMGLVGLGLLVFFVNPLTAELTFITLIGYAGIYTGYLKRASPQNIVIGGLAGAAPPLLGWTAVTNHFDPNALLLVLIIFVWTPPHFWALAIYRIKEYRKADIPMLPVTHGISYTKFQILIYSILLGIVSLLPFLVGMSHWIYLLAAILLDLRFIYWAFLLWRRDDAGIAMRSFRFSIVYLLALFVALLVDHYV